ncbi:MAG: nucleotide kinase domain-containing protein [Sedimenticola sp.]
MAISSISKGVRHEAFQHYFHFMEERMDIFWRKLESPEEPLTTDPIFQEYKFTNVYRASDRVSQYLIAEVIEKQDGNEAPENVLLRILLFKIFNRIDTWSFLTETVPEIRVDNFDPHELSKLLATRMQNQPIFSPAYIMTATGKGYSHLKYKHERWLSMVKKEIIDSASLERILEAKSLQEVYDILRECTFIGPFLAYQYAIDMNYSDAIDFDENSFVMAGIGAQRGIKKCFTSLHGYTYEDAIRYVLDNIDAYRERYGKQLSALPNRQPTLIDLQNCFCETDKYLRVKLPELNQGNTRIKQRYKKTLDEIKFTFPKKWNVSLDGERGFLSQRLPVHNVV